METDILEQTLLKSYDPEAVAKLLKKKAVGESESIDFSAKKVRVYECEEENLQFKVERLKAELKMEKNYRAHYETKARKAIIHIRKLEEHIKHLKTQQTKNFEALKSKLFTRIGDIEKDTFEVKDAVLSEFKNIADLRKPLENTIIKVVAFFKSELEDREKTIDGLKVLLSGKENRIDCFASGFSRSRELEEINDIIKHSKALNSEFVEIKKYCEEKDSTIKELKVEQKELTKQVENLKFENKYLEDRKNKLKDKRDVVQNKLAKTKHKLKKKSSKNKTLNSDVNNSRYEIESLNDLNENIEQQLSVLKEENKLLKERIAQKDADLSLSKLKERKDDFYQNENFFEVNNNFSKQDMNIVI